MTYVQRVAEYVAGIGYDDVPAHVRERVQTCLLYNLTMALAGWSADDRIGRAMRAVHAAPGEATLFASGERRSAPDAAFNNGALVTVRGQNDTHPEVVAHVGCVVIPAVLAVAETCGVAPREALAGMIAGYEVVAKLGRGAAAAVNARGLRSTPVFGVFGAAAAVARTLRLPPEQIANALAIASNLAGGILQTWSDGTSEWRLHIAEASRAGTVAALLAEQGFDGAPQALEGDSGFYKAYAGAVPTLALAGWDIEEIAFKPYPGCAFNQAPVHALRLLLRDKGIAGADVARVEVGMHPDDLGYPGVNSHGPFETTGGAIMSGPFMLAATLRDGAPFRRHFLEQYGSGPLHEVSRAVRLAVDPARARWGCRVKVELADGSAHEIVFDRPRPFVLSWQETVDLLRPVALEWNFPGCAQRYEQLVAAVQGLADVPDVAALLALCLRPR